MSAAIGSQNADALPVIPARVADFSVELRPFSTNRMHAPGGWDDVRRSRAYSTWLREARMSVGYEHKGRRVHGEYVLRLTVPGNGMDLGNLEKPISDALQAGMAIDNDKKAERIEVVRHRGRASSSVLVEIWACE